MPRPPRKKTTVALLAALAAVAVGVIIVAVSGPRFLGRPARPNVILISIDSLRPDHLGCYGYDRPTSPTIDRIATEGVLFETALSSTSWTLPAHAALFTALPDRVHGCTDDQKWLDGSRFTVAEAFREAGYRTAGFFSGPYLHPSFGFAQGFESYHDCTSYSGKSIELAKGEALVASNGQLSQDLMHLSHEDITNPIVLAEVKRWLAARPRGPFFLFIHLWDVHYDYVAPPPYDTMFDPGYEGPVDGRNLLRATRKPEGWTDADVRHLKALYDGEIRYTDDTLGSILAEVAKGGLEDSTIVAVLSDHGEAFYEHGLFGHRWTLHEEELRIPFVLRYPPKVPAGARVPDVVSIVDVAPTLLDLAGLPPLPAALGRNLTPLFDAAGRTAAAAGGATGAAAAMGAAMGTAAGGAARPSPVEAAAIAELLVPANRIHHFALRAPDWKLIYDLNRRSFSVFDLEGDPGEKAPLTEERLPFSMARIAEIYETTARSLNEAASRLPTPGERDTPPISRMTEEQLRSLGYLR